MAQLAKLPLGRNDGVEDLKRGCRRFLTYMRFRFQLPLIKPCNSMLTITWNSRPKVGQLPENILLTVKALREVVKSMASSHQDASVNRET